MSARKSTPPPDPDPSAGAPGAEAEPGIPRGSSILSDLRGGAAEGAALVDAAPSLGVGKVSVQTLIVVLVVTASVGILFMMRRQAMGAGINLNVAKIDYPLDKAPPAASVEQTRLLSELSRSTSPPQVPPERLQKNPFQLVSLASADALPEPTGPDAAAMAAAQARAAREERLRQVRTALDNVRVAGVMQGRVPLARINGRTVRVGDQVGEFFTVVEIKERSVVLQAEDAVHEVQMGDPAMGDDELYDPRPRAPGRPPAAPARR